MACVVRQQNRLICNSALGYTLNLCLVAQVAAVPETFIRPARPEALLLHRMANMPTTRGGRGRPHPLFQALCQSFTLSD
jgi:hypothetical protein